MKHLLVIRNSAMGDVALTVPAVKAALDTYQDLKITFVSHKNFFPFFAGMERLSFFPADFKSLYVGIGGIFKLAGELKKVGPFDAVLDLHAVIRSWLLSSIFSAMGIPVFRIDKGRLEKKAITRKHNKVFTRLKPSYERYADVFQKAGFPLSLGEGPWLSHQGFPEDFFSQKLLLPKNKTWIGVSPFAQHKGKKWPEDKSEKLIQALEETGYLVFLFGGGPVEKEKLDAIASKYQRVYSLCGVFPLGDELEIMRKMDVMITMDSSNLHMASLVGTPVVSIWGSTHSYAGFEPLGNNKELKVEVDPSILTCRPCSVFGNKPCFRGDYACLNWIEVKDVKARVLQALEEKLM
jgi:ADP-heptose:LPS heptosyltransferase